MLRAVFRERGMGDQLTVGDQLVSVVSEAGLAWLSSFNPLPPPTPQCERVVKHFLTQMDYFLL